MCLSENNTYIDTNNSVNTLSFLDFLTLLLYGHGSPLHDFLATVFPDLLGWDFFCAFDFPDEILFSDNAGVLWSVYQLIYSLIVSLLHVKGFAVICNHLADQGCSVSHCKTIEAEGLPLPAFCPSPPAPRRERLETCLCQNSSNLHGDFYQTVPLSLSEKGGLTEPETEKECFPAAVRHTWAHGGTKCLAKKGWISPFGPDCLRPQMPAYIPDGRGKRLSTAEQHQARNLSFQ